jgi:hypothetical protein
VGLGAGEGAEVGEGTGVGVSSGEGEDAAGGTDVDEGEGAAGGTDVGEGVSLPGIEKPGTGMGGRGRVCCPLMLMVVAFEISMARPKIMAMIMVIASAARKSSFFGGC